MTLIYRKSKIIAVISMFVLMREIKVSTVKVNAIYIFNSLIIYLQKAFNNLSSGHMGLFYVRTLAGRKLVHIVYL